MKTVNVKIWGGSFPAFAEATTEGPIVRVWDDIAGHFVALHSLTPAQERYVIGRTMVCNRNKA